MDPIFPLIIISAIAGAAALGWRALRVRRRSTCDMRRMSWKVICYRCERIDRRPVPDCEECRSTRMRPMTKYQAEGGGTGFWPDPDGLMVSSLIEGQWKPSDDESDFPQGRRHAPLFDLDFRADWSPHDEGGTLIVHRMLPLPQRFALIETLERLELVASGSMADAAASVIRSRDGIPGFRAPGSDATPDSAFHLRVPARLVPSRTAGHFHLYLETEMDWPEYLALMRAMVDAGLLEKEWVDMNERRKMAMLRKPEREKAPI